MLTVSPGFRPGLSVRDAHQGLKSREARRVSGGPRFETLLSGGQARAVEAVQP
jgi:hypothetical protein